MAHFQPDPETIVATETDLRALFPPVHDIAVQKSLSALDSHAQDFISRSPFLCIATQDDAGRADISPRGDPCGFVSVLDPTTLAIPDRPGNNRLDSLSNLVSNPSVGLIFMIPGIDDTLRVNGRARLTTDARLLNAMRVADRLPRIAILVDVEEVFLHCAKAFRRSRLWDPDSRQDRGDMPSLVRMILDQTTGAPSDADALAKIDADLEEDYERTMY